jgi:hypothetical protein
MPGMESTQYSTVYGSMYDVNLFKRFQGTYVTYVDNDINQPVIEARGFKVTSKTPPTNFTLVLKKTELKSKLN